MLKSTVLLTKYKNIRSKWFNMVLIVNTIRYSYAKRNSIPYLCKVNLNS